MLTAAIIAVKQVPSGSLNWPLTIFSEQGWFINDKKNPDVICQNNDVLVFNINAPGHPFYIKTAPVRTLTFFSPSLFLSVLTLFFQVTGTARTFPGTIQGKQGTEVGQMSLTYVFPSTFTPSLLLLLLLHFSCQSGSWRFSFRCDELTQAASPLYYQCGVHSVMKGRICVGSCDNFSQSGAGSGFEQFGDQPAQQNQPEQIDVNKPQPQQQQPAVPTQSTSSSTLTFHLHLRLFIFLSFALTPSPFFLREYFFLRFLF